ncbi:MAG TPA: FAD-linked oxidase C-terminal domain-containing protein [Parachlamydiaceae bacterium]|nr:FAD-linked oxidase C-terminal domain-containing protein [Parachlamydiaceae bacterium]
MESFFKELKSKIKGEVHHDPITCAIYSVDASIYEVKPIGVVIPKDKDDLITTLKIAAKNSIPVTPRGAATGITGSCLGQGLIIDISTHLNKILEINIAEEYAICEPGVVQDRLNEALAPSGYRLGPETSTGNRATLGGMLANNSAGSHSLIYGCMVDHIQEVELALAGGEILSFGKISNEEWKNKREENNTQGKIYREIHHILNSYSSAIEQHFPKIPRHVSGYNLDKLLASQYSIPAGLNLAQLITGSEGTLGIATKIKIGISKKLRFTGACVLHLENVIPGMRFIETMLSHHPIALEMIDEKIINSARLSPAVQSKLEWLVGNPQAVFIAEFEGDTHDIVEAKLNDFTNAMRALKFTYAQVILNDPKKVAAVWEVRKAGLGLLLSKRSYSRAIAFVEDLSIAPEKLADFMQEFCAYIKSIGKEAGIYGHIGSGCMHIRPFIDLRKKEELALMEEILKNVSDIVLAYGGAMSGEHGDGLVRSWLNEKMFGQDIYLAFKGLKSAFDPGNLMNPGKIVNGQSLIENLRLSPESENNKISTFLDFSHEGGFELAADMCNGNGQCRKKESVMCPSFQASGDEYDTTRARAQTLRSIIHGKLPMQELTGQALMDVLDLCIECKGCKKECPSQVDMAKMKSEILYQYQEKHGYSWRNRLFASLHRLNYLAAPFSGIFNALASSSIGKTIQGWMGIAPQRTFPLLAKERFSTWFNKQEQKSNNKRVIIFNDTYTEFNEPGIGKAAFKVLTKLGYKITLVQGQCCGRPLISKGFLKEAKNQALELVIQLDQIVNEDGQMIVLEPSCLSALRDDYKGLLGANVLLYRLISNTFSFEEYLQRHLLEGKLPLPFMDIKKDIWVHGHCHQKALVGTGPTLDVLRGIEGFHVREIESGCCGMAGSFGYEKEHYHFSMKIGGLKLFPKIRETQSDDIIVASGMSCRSQIQDGTQIRALHLAEAIANQMRSP